MTYILSLLAVLAFSFTNAYISDLGLDSPTGSLFVTEDNNLYQVNTQSFQQVAHHLTINDLTDAGTLYAAKRGSKRVLYAFEEDYTYAASKFVMYSLPLPKTVTLTPAKSVVLNPGLSLGSTYDQTDMIVIHSVSRNLTLVNLNTLEVEDSLYYWTGTRNFGRNVIYNHQTNHVTVFATRVPVRGDYGLSSDEFVIQNGKFVSVPSTYDCQCQTNPTASPFDKVVFAEGSCKIDYSVSPAKLWCAYPEGKKLFAFNAANLSQFEVIPTAASFDSVTYDFTHKIAYAINGNNEDQSLGWSVAKVSLANGSTMKSYTNSAFRIDASTFQLDVSSAHLFLAQEESSNVVSLNINTMSGLKSLTLNSTATN